MCEDERTMEEKLLDGIDSLIWYNGLGKIIERWLALVPKTGSRVIACPTNYKLTEREINEDKWAYSQLQSIWILAVESFGSYGTSPRFGWIEDIEGFRTFVRRITKTYREAKEIEDEIG